MIVVDSMFHALVVAACVSFSLSLLIILTQGLHGHISFDSDLLGVQKVHVRPVPRIGGIALFFGLLAGFLYQVYSDPGLQNENDVGGVLLLLLSGVPALIAGLVEDLTKKVSIKVRLFSTFASALLACWLVGASLPRIDVWGMDELLMTVPLVAVLLTVFAVAGVSNSINIIDGFNGVAGSAVVIHLLGMGFIAWEAGDSFLVGLAALGVGTTLGFLLVNFPTGRLFMGDGGAYLLGFWMAEIAVLLIARNPSINAWQVLAVCAYPIIEVLYTMYRRKVIRKTSPGDPDALHLHTLIYRRLVWRLLAADARRPWKRNATVACITAPWIAAMTVLAIMLAESMPFLVVLINITLYLAVYTRLVRGHWRLNPLLAFGLRPESSLRSMRTDAAVSEAR